MTECDVVCPVEVQEPGEPPDEDEPAGDVPVVVVVEVVDVLDDEAGLLVTVVESVSLFGEDEDEAGLPVPACTVTHFLFCVSQKVFEPSAFVVSATLGSCCAPVTRPGCVPSHC